MKAHAREPTHYSTRITVSNLSTHPHIYISFRIHSIGHVAELLLYHQHPQHTCLLISSPSTHAYSSAAYMPTLLHCILSSKIYFFLRVYKITTTVRKHPLREGFVKSIYTDCL